MEVSLAKALKLKNRQAAKVANIQRQISGSNSHLAGSEPDFDAQALLVELKKEVDTLVEIKRKINQANAPIQPTIYRLAELKGMVAFLRGLSTQRGKVGGAFMMMQAPEEYEAQIDANQVESEVADLEREIDDLQDSLDAHNASVRIQIDIPE